jgi:hypothetical protein
MRISGLNARHGKSPNRPPRCGVVYPQTLRNATAGIQCSHRPRPMERDHDMDKKMMIKHLNNVLDESGHAEETGRILREWLA